MLNAEFEKTRGIMIKIGNATYLIPHQMNPNITVGDHSIECVAKSKFLNSGTDCETTARIVNYASRKFVNGFLTAGLIDIKGIFGDVSDMFDRNPRNEKGDSYSA